MFRLTTWARVVAPAAGLLGMLMLAISAEGQGPPGNTAPKITQFTAQQKPGKKFLFSGVVTDNTPQVCAVTVSGVATGNILCNKGGDFSGELAVTSIGVAKGIAFDGQLFSPEVSVTLTNAAPTITNFRVVDMGGGAYLVSGKVTDEVPAGMAVTFSGALTGSAIALASGDFSTTVLAAPGLTGLVNAGTEDQWGSTATASANIQ